MPPAHQARRERRGVALQPWAPLVNLFHRLQDGGAGLDAFEAAELRAIREPFRRLFPARERETEIMLFRLGMADPPTARSLRLPVDDVFPQ